MDEMKKIIEELYKNLGETKKVYQQQNEEFESIMVLNDSIIDAQNSAMEKLNDRNCFDQLTEIINNI